MNFQSGRGSQSVTRTRHFPPHDHKQPAPSNGRAVMRAKTEIAHRRRREQFFPDAVFVDPAWDLLLDLFVAGCEGQTVSVSSACIAAEAPVTTALRHLKRLEKQGLIERRSDPADARRYHVQLSSVANARMFSLFAPEDPPIS